MLIRNEDQRIKDYEEIKNMFRPGHADYTYWMKYGNRDYRGAAAPRGRETACRVAAGAVAKKILRDQKINIVALPRLPSAGFTRRKRFFRHREEHGTRAGSGSG